MMLLRLLPPKDARDLPKQAFRLVLLRRRGRGRYRLLMLFLLMRERPANPPQQALRLVLLGNRRGRGWRDGLLLGRHGRGRWWRDGLGVFLLATEGTAELVEEAFVVVGVGLGGWDGWRGLLGDGRRDGCEGLPAVLVVAVALLVVLAAKRIADLVEE
ncbi:hypothetical protein GGF50DRAFT_100076 [Schizophyllum commune]